MELKRIIIGFTLILILSVLCVYYNTNHESHREYPSTAAILSYYPEGSMVSVSGDITNITGNGFHVQDDYNGKKVTYDIETSIEDEPGDAAEVRGILGPSYNIKSTDIII